MNRTVIMLGIGRNNNALADLNFILDQKPDFDQVRTICDLYESDLSYGTREGIVTTGKAVFTNV